MAILIKHCDFLSWYEAVGFILTGPNLRFVEKYLFYDLFWFSWTGRVVRRRVFDTHGSRNQANLFVKFVKRRRAG